ncbi:MAG: hypothetical protein IPO09_12430 [Anaeromyxobacter sp.]|nr:hypothetical protein [Anaeromyxobacter sp.]
MTIRPSLLTAAALALVLSACGQRADDFADATPDLDGLSLELAGGEAEGLAAAPAPTARTAALAEAAAPAAADELGDARQALQALNAEVRRVLEQVAEVARLDPVQVPGDVKVYGPAVRCVQRDLAGACTAEASLRLTIRRHVADTWSWTLQARPTASTLPEDFQPVLAGWLHRNGDAHRGRGRAAFNLTNLRTAAPGYTGQGWLLAGFGHLGQAKSVAYRLVGFTPDASTQPPVTAGFVGHRSAAGLTRVRVATFADALAGDNAAFPREVVLAHLGWQAGLGGRGYLVVANWTDAAGNVHGDLPATPGGAAQYWLGRGCWGPGGALRVKEWRLCTRGLGAAACLATDPAVVEPAGATWAGSCTGFTGEEPPPASVGPGAEQGTQGEPAGPGGEPPACEAPPVDPSDTDPPAGA